MPKNEMIGIATNKKIIDLYKMMNEGSLILQPSFQRNLVWNDKHKENFLETVLLHYPFPEVYFASGDVDLELMQAKTLVVDGQQRLSTIYQYLTDSQGLVLTKIPKFSELDDSDKESFLTYSVVVRDLGTTPLPVIKEIFKRINSVQYALNAMEINNALYEGEFISTAKEITKTGLIDDLDILNGIETGRMKDIEFVLTIMATAEIGGYFSGDKEVENYIQKYENDYPHKVKMIECFKRVLNTILQLNLPSDSIWNRRSSMFSLISELMLMNFNSDNPLPSIENLKKILEELEQRIINSKNEGLRDKYNEFYSAIFQGTAKKRGRVIRGTLIRESLN